MFSSRQFDCAVIGGGPTGIAAALVLAKRLRVALVVDRAPTLSSVPRLDVVPAAFVGLLVEMGLHPRTIGVTGILADRWLAWRDTEPAPVTAPPTTIVERPSLEYAMFLLALRCPNLEVHVEREPPFIEGATARGSNWIARRAFDATGRRAIFARRRVRPFKPLVAQTFLARCQRPGQMLRIAALTEGYAYRVTSSRFDMLGIVGRGLLLRQPYDALKQEIERIGSGWLLQGFPAPLAVVRGRAYPASVQWTDGHACMPIGDAALARDILASQGIANGVSEGHYAAALDTANDALSFLQRHAEQRSLHLRALQAQLAACRFRHHPVWSDYRRFIDSNCREVVGPKVALRQRRLISP